MVTDTHQLIDAVKQYYPVAQFFKDRYFPDGKPFFSEEVWIDSKKQGRKIAPFVIPKINGITIESEGIRTDRIKAPTIALKMPITPEDLEKRAFGEDPNSNRAPADREREVEADHIDEMRNSILRRHEKMCTDIITTGEIEIKQYANANDAAADKNAQVRVLKYYETAFDNRYKTSKKFKSMTAQEKIDTLHKMASTLHKRGFKASDLVLTGDISAEMFSDPEFLDYYDKRRANLGTIDPTTLPDGVACNGTINVNGVLLTIFTYDEYYLAADGTETAFLPPYTVAMLTPGLGTTAYGQVTFVKDGDFQSYAEPLVPRSVASDVDNIKEVQLFSRPVPYPVFTDSWLYLNADKTN